MTPTTTHDDCGLDADWVPRRTQSAPDALKKLKGSDVRGMHYRKCPYIVHREMFSPICHCRQMSLRIENLFLFLLYSWSSLCQILWWIKVEWVEKCWADCIVAFHTYKYSLIHGKTLYSFPSTFLALLETSDILSCGTQIEQRSGGIEKSGFSCFIG